MTPAARCYHSNLEAKSGIKMGTFVKVAEASEIPTAGGKMVMVGGKEIALFRIDGKFFALDNTCTHAGGPLCEGEVQGDQVECPWHSAHFELATGKCLAPPARVDVASYPVRQQGDDIEIEI
jgi:NAD(P)H-dependent nitrite reductase small subunit